jgi:hypothetical protein
VKNVEMSGGWKNADQLKQNIHAEVIVRDGE